jgi:hypothetical protein
MIPVLQAQLSILEGLKWIIRSNQIKDCPVTVNHIDTADKICMMMTRLACN